MEGEEEVEVEWEGEEAAEAAVGDERGREIGVRAVQSCEANADSGAGGGRRRRALPSPRLSLPRQRLPGRCWRPLPLPTTQTTQRRRRRTTTKRSRRERRRKARRTLSAVIISRGKGEAVGLMEAREVRTTAAKVGDTRGYSGRRSSASTPSHRGWQRMRWREEERRTASLLFPPLPPTPPLALLWPLRSLVSARGCPPAVPSLSALRSTPPGRGKWRGRPSAERGSPRPCGPR